MWSLFCVQKQAIEDFKSKQNTDNKQVRRNWEVAKLPYGTWKKQNFRFQVNSNSHILFLSFLLYNWFQKECPGHFYAYIYDKPFIWGSS